MLKFTMKIVKMFLKKTQTGKAHQKLITAHKKNSEFSLPEKDCKVA